MGARCRRFESCLPDHLPFRGVDGLFRNGIVELLESQDDVRGNENVIVLPPPGIFVYPGTILALVAYEKTAKFLAPVNFGSIGAFELVDTCGDQGLRVCYLHVNVGAPVVTCFTSQPVLADAVAGGNAVSHVALAPVHLL